jgi:septal ring factor EnvC (AmiA/AmiB activator)
LKFDWPVSGQIVYECWTEPGTDAIAVAAEYAATVRAAQSGIVAYAGPLKRYGEVVMIEHGGGFVSATYGDIDDLRVKSGDPVERGQPIAVIRSVQDFPGIGLKFELMRGAKPIGARPYMSAPEPPREYGDNFHSAN